MTLRSACLLAAAAATLAASSTLVIAAAPKPVVPLAGWYIQYEQVASATNNTGSTCPGVSPLPFTGTNSTSPVFIRQVYYPGPAKTGYAEHENFLTLSSPHSPGVTIAKATTATPKAGAVSWSTTFDFTFTGFDSGSNIGTESVAVSFTDVTPTDEFGTIIETIETSGTATDVGCQITKNYTRIFSGQGPAS